MATRGQTSHLIDAKEKDTMRHITRGLAVAAVLVVGTAGVLTAQQHRHGQQQDMQGRMQQMQQGQQGEHMMMMGRLGAFSPERLLARKDDLQLSDQQVAQLTTLQEQTAATVAQATESHDTHRAQLMEAMAAESVDRNAVLSHMEAAHAAMGTVRRTELQSLFQAMEILTAEQKDMVNGWAAPGQGRQMRQGQGGSCCGN